MDPAIFIMGPTASGKTGLAMRLCQHLPCEIISVDSALIYQGMDIGAAKPTVAELQQYPHYLLDILDPAQAYSAAQFRHDALTLMADISRRGNIPLLVGGTMMYFKVLLQGISEVPKADPVIRQQILAEAEQYGWAYMHRQLQQVDAASAARIHPNDPQRLQRALEIWRGTGVSMTQWREQERHEPFPYSVLQLALVTRQRALLHQRIAQRFDAMLAAGFEDEVRSLYRRGDLHIDMPSIRAVGYRQMWLYLQGDYDHDCMREKGIAATRQLAKRQLTWLRSWPDLHWLYSDQVNSWESGADEAGDMLVEQSLQLVNQELNLQI